VSRKRRPARRHPGIQPIWSDGRWRWRARLERDGRVHVGPLRDDQAEAAGDRLVLEARRGAFRQARGITLRAALDQVESDAPARVAPILRFADVEPRRAELDVGELHPAELAGAHACERDQLEQVGVGLALGARRDPLPFGDIGLADPAQDVPYLLGTQEARARRHALDRLPQAFAHLWGRVGELRDPERLAEQPQVAAE